LRDSAAKQLDVELYVCRKKANPLYDHVETPITQRVARGLRIANVRPKHLCPGRHRVSPRLASAQERQVDAPSERETSARGADDSSSSDEEHLHGGWMLTQAGRGSLLDRRRIF
jgi:hypothetical protein